jgi:hypothetical protein
MDATSIDFAKLIPLLIPIILLQVGLQIAALVNLYHQPASNIKGSKWLWVAIIILGEIIGPVVYFLLARRES